MATLTATATTDPFVAVVIPCRNEARFIGPVIDSLRKSSYPREKLEVLFVDGMSTDGTRAALEAAAKEEPFIRVLDNPLLTAPAAMNLGIRAARAEVIVRMDAHSEYPDDYITRCVRLLRSDSKIGNAGGRLVPLPHGPGPWARAVAFVTTHRFGVGGAAFRTGSRPGLVDTVPFGAFSRAVLDEVGLYDVRLTRNQDNELNARLQQAGYMIVFDPSIRVNYRNQSDLKGLLRQAYFSGIWNIYTLVLYPYTWKWRRFIPMFFTGYMALLPAGFLPVLPLGLYALLAAVFSLHSGGSPADRLRVAATFVAYHLTYGAGSLLGIVHVLTGRWRAHLGRPLPTGGFFYG
jgi:glycosyltransferase involved in cell wall biosynthesis